MAENCIRLFPLSEKYVTLQLSLIFPGLCPQRSCIHKRSRYDPYNSLFTNSNLFRKTKPSVNGEHLVKGMMDGVSIQHFD